VIVVAAGLVAAALLGIVAAHMVRPSEELRLSAARFFANLTGQTPPQSRWRLANPLTSMAFWLRLAAVGLALAALLAACSSRRGAPTQGLGVWLVMDTSASLTAQQGDQARWALAQAAADAALEQADAARGELPLCIRLFSFDLVLSAHGDALSTAASAREAVNRMAPRALGTDLSVVQSWLDTPVPGETCPPTHVVVISDQPAPAWANQAAGNPELVWQDIAQPVDNVGFTGLSALRDPLTGQVAEISVVIQAFGRVPNGVHLTIRNPADEIIADEPAVWRADQTWRLAFALGEPGQYSLALEPADAYQLDDHAAIDLGAATELSVDCRLSDCQWFAGLGWNTTSRPAALAVVSNLEVPEPDIPTLVVGPGYELDQPTQPIRDFREGDPLLADLNFDVVELLGLPSQPGRPDFLPVLRGANETIWLARRDEPPAVMIPGLPLTVEPGADDSAGRASLVIFFNSVRWLLRSRELPPLYTLTSAAEPEASGTRLALHPGEGDTAQAPRSLGSLEAITPGLTSSPDVPVWPLWLLAAVGLWALERILSGVRGDKWR